MPRKTPLNPPGLDCTLTAFKRLTGHPWSTGGSFILLEIPSPLESSWGLWGSLGGSWGLFYTTRDTKVSWGSWYLLTQKHLTTQNGYL